MNNPATTADSDILILETDELNFATDVLERSKTVPVVVDFWAPWCGPCRMLGPVLERLAQQDAGAWILAKVNTDENPRLSMQYQIQGIPAVKAFRDGQVVAEFVGAQPETMVRTFLQKLVPSKADAVVKQAAALEAASDLPAAEAGYREALGHEPMHAGARLGLGRTLLAADRFDEALDALGAVLAAAPRGRPEWVEAERLAAQARFRRDAALSGDEIAARHRLTADPNDLDARITLATALAAKGSYREALEGLLAVLERDRGAARERAREAMLGIFTALGDEHELTQEYRPRLAAALW